jgi:hypothetical protein
MKKKVKSILACVILASLNVHADDAVLTIAGAFSPVCALQTTSINLSEVDLKVKVKSVNIGAGVYKNKSVIPINLSIICNYSQIPWLIKQSAALGRVKVGSGMNTSNLSSLNTSFSASPTVSLYANSGTRSPTIYLIFGPDETVLSTAEKTFAVARGWQGAGTIEATIPLTIVF